TLMNDLKSRISFTAQELFLTEGVEGVSMRRIAERVGVTATAIYRHFPNKEAILEEIIGAGLTILSSYLAPALKANDPYERLKGLIDAYLRFAIEQPRYFDLAFLVPGPNTHLSQELERHTHATFKLAVEQVGLCMQAGVFRKGDPIETAVYLWSTAHGLVMLHRMNRFGSNAEDFTRLYRSTIERAIEGLREKT
ncbi:MAG: TetR/AcrR family transcriptional regulator, partial [Acidobacteria bacterium]|nr:TetR/AcrR family transcriptional regulator [Acidobacteriota bacterium]